MSNTEIYSENEGVKVFRGLIWATGLSVVFWSIVALVIFLIVK